MNAIQPVPTCDISIRLGTMTDLPFIDALQKQHAKALGFFPRAQMEGYLKNEWMLIAEQSGRPVGYVASRDRYLKRDELGVIYQLCVSPNVQRKLIGAALIKGMFDRSAYGCRLYCCWCAKDLAANYFWESLGFVPIAFRAGSSKKARVHIFWQKQIVEGDIETKWWYPCQTNQGAIREDRIVFPIPPGVSWKDVEAISVPGVARAARPCLANKTMRMGASSAQLGTAEPAVPQHARSVGFGFIGFALAAPVKGKNPKRERAPKVKEKLDPKYITAARELRDRWMETVNQDGLMLTSEAKYDVARQLPASAAAAKSVRRIEAMPQTRAA